MDGDRGGALNPREVTLSSGAVRFRSQGCLRGLKWTYRLPSDTDWDALECALQAAHAGRLVRASERWGACTVRRYVMQFEAEFRFGERPGELSLLHRVMSPWGTRSAHHRLLEALIAEVLARKRSAVAR